MAVLFEHPGTIVMQVNGVTQVDGATVAVCLNEVFILSYIVSRPAAETAWTVTGMPNGSGLSYSETPTAVGLRTATVVANYVDCGPLTTFISLNVYDCTSMGLCCFFFGGGGRGWCVYFRMFGLTLLSFLV